MFQVIWEILKNSLIRERVDILEKLTRFKVVDRSNVLYKKKFEFLSYVIKVIFLLISKIIGNRRT